MSEQINKRRQAIRRHATALVCGLGVALTGTLAEAKPPIACGTFHGIQRGDTLFRIAVRAYDDGWKYKRIFAANRDLLPNEKSVEIGDQIFVPCLDGTGPATRREALASAAATAAATAEPAAPLAELAAETQAIPESAPAATDPAGQSGPIENLRRSVASLVLSASLGGKALVDPHAPAKSPEPDPLSTAAGGTFTLAPREGPARLLTGAGLPPFADEALREGGMITELVTRAIRHASPQQATQVAFVGNWEAHLDGLLLGGALDVGFPWVKPDCSAEGGLSPQAQLLCAEFAFSRPFFEIPVATYARADGLQVSASGKVCQVTAPYSFETGAATITEATPAACFARLLRNEVDTVVLQRRDGETVLDHYGLGEKVREVEALATTRTLHAVAPKSSPAALAYLAMIDAGLERLMASGEWFRIVSTHQGSLLALAE